MNAWEQREDAGAGLPKRDAEELPSVSHADSADYCGATTDLEAQVTREVAERERLKAELELRHCALDAASAHFMITDQREHGRIIYVNRALARDHGYEPEELVGRTAAQLVPADLNPTQLEQIVQAQRKGEVLRTEVRSRRKDGSMFWAGIFLGPVRDRNGRVTHYVSIGADITARLEAERAQRELQDRLLNEVHERERLASELRLAQKLEAVGRLAAGIAHEINTPIQYVGDSVLFLQSALGDLESLLRSYQDAVGAAAGSPLSAATLARLKAEETRADIRFLTDEIPKAFQRTLDGVSRVAAIVRAMKEFAHPNVIEQSGADLNHAIETTLTVARSEYKYAATVETHFAELPQVLCNVGELNQVLLNIIVNAAHAIEASGKDATTGIIRITTETAGPWVIVTIIDNGCGISEEHRDKIFEPFFTTKEVGKGTGQGLAIARSIVVDKHGGIIDMQSATGVGTRFTLKLPIGGRPQSGTP
jgi:PAS domain S-box-containing protein